MVAQAHTQPALLYSVVARLLPDPRDMIGGYTAVVAHARVALEVDQSMDVQAYLRRINYRGEFAPTAAALRELHRAHLLAVPFENLDIHLGRPIVLEQQALFDKIVTRWRGGFCYELNGLFALLLRDLGFNVTLLAAGVARADGSFGPEFDHLTLLVTSPLSVVSG